MAGQSKNRNIQGKEKNGDVYEHMVGCVSLGLSFKFYRNRSNKTLIINLAENTILYLDFDLWSSSMQHAFLYRGDAQLSVSLSSVKKLMVEEGKRKSVIVCKELKFWIRTLYVNDISFEWYGNYVKIITEHCKDFELLIFFNGNGVREAKYRLGRRLIISTFKVAWRA